MDPRLERYGDYRRLAKAPAITYLIAQVNNQSDNIITMYTVVIVTGSGQQIEATSISNYVDGWRDTFAGEGGDYRKYTMGVALSNASSFFLHPGARGTAILGAKEPNESSSTQQTPSTESKPNASNDHAGMPGPQLRTPSGRLVD
jgi:hypothetical protein